MLSCSTCRVSADQPALSTGGSAATNPASSQPSAQAGVNSGAQISTQPNDNASEDISSNEIPDALPPPGGWTRQTFTIPKCLIPPKIDGRLTDECWRTAFHAPAFYRYGGNALVRERTEAWICADSSHLFLAYHCQFHDPAHLKASETRRQSTGVLNDDFVAIDLDSQNTHRGYSSFVVNALGTQFESLEGGTADNITWAGDWKAAAHRTRDGYTVEISIPFALLRYPKGTRAFSFVLYRKLPDEADFTSFPYEPPAAIDAALEAQYLQEFNGIEPPFYTPRPIFLPYTLATVGDGSSVRNGIDIKYPLTTSLTGVASLYPDFATIEQAVENVNFSYTEKLLSDSRPFFAEGAGFLPGQDLFYSRTITQMDGGVKVVGKQGDNTIGFLATTTQGGVGKGQSDYALNFNHAIGLFSTVGLESVGDQQNGLESNNVDRLSAVFGWKTGPKAEDQRFLSVWHAQSWQGGQMADGYDRVEYSNQSDNSSNPPLGKPYYNFQYLDIGPNFVSDLGYVPYIDLRGFTANFGQYNQWSKNRLQKYQFGFNLYDEDHHTGGFFQKGITNYASIGTNNGYYVELDSTVDKHEIYNDQYESLAFNWSQLKLFRDGGLLYNFGHQQGEKYTYFSVNQGQLISKPFSVRYELDELTLGPSITKQQVFTAAYILDQYRTIGGRLVNINGATDIFLSFSQQVRSGTDLFIIFGDPNASTTKSIVSVKVVRPF